MLMSRYQHRLYPSHLSGFTLIEILIALVINGIIFSALLAAFIANLNHYQKVVDANRLNQELQMTLQIMTDEIRRAGYWANARNDIGLAQNNNPFMVSGVDVATNVGQDCILFAYDHDANGTLPSISSGIDDERYGFRLNGGAVQSRPPGANFDCTAAANNWENMTDTNVVTVTALTFAPVNYTITTGPGTQGVQLRSVNITLTGRLTNDSTVTKTLTQHVRIRNDKFIP